MSSSESLSATERKAAQPPFLDRHGRKLVGVALTLFIAAAIFTGLGIGGVYPGELGQRFEILHQKQVPSFVLLGFAVVILPTATYIVVKLLISRKKTEETPPPAAPPSPPAPTASASSRSEESSEAPSEAPSAQSAHSSPAPSVRSESGSSSASSFTHPNTELTSFHTPRSESESPPPPIRRSPRRRSQADSASSVGAGVGHQRSNTRAQEHDQRKALRVRIPTLSRRRPGRLPF